MKDGLCSLPGKEPICIQFIAKVGIPSSLFSCPDREQLLVKCDFCFAPQKDFLIVRQQRRERGELWLSPQAGWKRGNETRDPG